MPHLSSSVLTIWQLLREHNVMALGLLIFIEEVGVPLPLPGNLLLMYLGWQIAGHRISGGQTVTIMTAASMAGSICLYCLAAQIGRPAVLRWGRFVGLDHKRVARIESWLDRYGSITILVGRCFPGLRTPTSAVGGVFGVPLPKFIPFTTLAAFFWTAFWLVLGGVLGRRLHLEEQLSGHHFVGTILLAVACLLVLPTIGVISARRQRQKEAAAERARLAHPDGVASPDDGAQPNHTLPGDVRAALPQASDDTPAERVYRR